MEKISGRGYLVSTFIRKASCAYHKKAISFHINPDGDPHRDQLLILHHLYLHFLKRDQAEETDGKGGSPRKLVSMKGHKFREAAGGSIHGDGILRNVGGVPCS